MDEAPTTVIIQRYLDAIPGDTAAEPIIRELLEQAVGRLRMLCARFLYKSYPRLTRHRLGEAPNLDRFCAIAAVVHLTRLVKSLRTKL